MGLAELFQEIGRSVEAAWRPSRSDERAFSAAATKVLEEVELPADFDALSLLREVAGASWLPQQEDIDATFGEPPLTVYRSRDFFVSVLFWFDGTTTIHEHSFSGAFRVLAGSSIHVRYEFVPSDVISRRLQFGEIVMRDAEVLRVGDVRPISASSDGAHSLFHLERPSITLVIRTYAEQWALPQLDYYRPGMAFDPGRREPGIRRQLQVLQGARELGLEHGLQLAKDVIAASDPFAGVCVVEDWFRFGDRGEPMNDLLETFAGVHTGLGSSLRTVYDERLRELGLLTRRSMLRDPGHRLFLAILLNLPTSAARQQVLRSLFPHDQPNAVVARMLRELSAPELRGVSGLNLGPDDLEAFDAVLATSDGADDELREVSQRMRRSDVLQRLFS